MTASLTDGLSSNGASPQDDPQDQPPEYTTLDGWVDGYFRPMFLHRAGDGSRARWCSYWWHHPEAIGRLAVLWQSWEAARWEPASLPGWWVELDHHLPILLGTDGPFRLCRPPDGDRAGSHETLEPPVNEPAPPGWWE